MRIAIAILLVLIIGAGVAVWYLWEGAVAAPTWYQPPDPEDAAVVERAEQVEYRLTEELQKIRPAETTWRVEIPERSINAWLASRLPEWIAHEATFNWPEELGMPQVRIAENGVSIAVPADVPDGAAGGRIEQAVLVARVVPSVVEGKLNLDLQRIGIGRMLLPADDLESAIERVADLLPDDFDAAAFADTLEQFLHGTDALPADIDLADGRRVTVLSARCLDGAIELTNCTVAGEAASSEPPNGE